MGAFVKVSLGILGSLLAGSTILGTLVAAIYGAGITHERAAAHAAIVRAEKAEAEQTRLAAVANQNAATAKQLAADNEAQALAYAADAEQSRSDADRIELARQAAVIAGRTCQPVAAAEPQPLVGDAVHSALLGRPVLETDDLAPSLKAAMAAIRQADKKKGRRR